MQHVAQSRMDGCGIACLAMITGLSYRAAARAVFGAKRSSRHVVDIDQLSRALKKLGYRTKPTRSFRHKNAHAVILGFWWTPWNPLPYEGHFVVYYPKRDEFLDPDPIPWATRERIVRLWRMSGCETLVVFKGK